MIVIVDYKMGNLDSVVRAFARVGAPARVSADPAEVGAASGLVLPGVGAFAQAMHNLAEDGLLPALHRKALEEGTPVLGICLGFQLMSDHGEEGDADGLGWIGGVTRRFRFPEGAAPKIPHMGWNDVSPRQADNPLFEGLDPAACFYFAHSYHVTDPRPECVATVTEYGETFVSSARLGNLFGTQFHPEKSYLNGLRLLRNFAGLAAHA